MLEFVQKLCEGCRAPKNVWDRPDQYTDCLPTPDVDDRCIQRPLGTVSEHDSFPPVEPDAHPQSRRQDAGSGSQVVSDISVISKPGTYEVQSSSIGCARSLEVVNSQVCGTRSSADSLGLENKASSAGGSKTIDGKDVIALDSIVSTGFDASEPRSSSTLAVLSLDGPSEIKAKDQLDTTIKTAVAPGRMPKRKPKATAKPGKEGGMDSSRKLFRAVEKGELEHEYASGKRSMELAPRNELNWVIGAVSTPDCVDTSSSSLPEDLDLPDMSVKRQQIQVLLASGWSAVPQTESDLIFANLAAGESKFGIHARGAMYAIDFSNPHSGMQTNSKTGKKRRLRIVSDDVKDAVELDKSTSEPASNPQNSEAIGVDKDQQLQYGPQSKRGSAQQYQLSVLDAHAHAKECFETLARNELKLCGEWAVFYHSYSFSALIYEVHAAVGAVLFRFRSKYAPLPRLIMQEFLKTPDAASLMQSFESKYVASEKDHHPEYRALAISAMCSLVALGPEASPPVVFVAGYSQADLSFKGVLEHLLGSCLVPKSKIKKVAADILELSERSGLDVSQFGGKTCASGKAGHLLQIFIKRSLVDRLVYAAQPWGLVDYERQPISSWLNADNNTNWGQARILAHPELFMQANSVRMHVVSADPTFHSNRAKFQEELTQLLGIVLAEPGLRRKAASALYGGKLPQWWTPEDQRKVSK